MTLTDVIMQEPNVQTLQRWLKKVPYAVFLDIRADIRNGEIVFILPENKKLIGNPSLPALRGGDVVATYAKRELPNYQVFDERRYFTPGQGVCVFEAGGFRIGLLICEDAWFESQARLAKEAGAELLAVINASPFHVGKGYERATARFDEVGSGIQGR